MKRNYLTVGLIAAMMVPAAAQAQTREIRDDRREVREERRELRDARRYGDRDDVREERREYREDRRELRQDRRELREDRRDWRQDRRYSGYRAPFRYQQFRIGAHLRPNHYSPSYRLGYDRRWGVQRPGRNLSYVRHYNDLLLVNVRNGRVVRVYRNHFRWR